MRLVSWIGTLVIASVGVTAYVHTQFVSRHDLVSIQHSIGRIYSRVERIEDKVDRLLTKQASHTLPLPLEITKIQQMEPRSSPQYPGYPQN